MPRSVHPTGSFACAPGKGPDPAERVQVGQPSRREIVRKGAKLAFVSPVISTLFAHQAWAQASGNQSCYPLGHACTTVPGDPEPCCPGLTCNGAPGTCQ